MGELLMKRKEMGRFPVSLPSGPPGNDFSLEHFRCSSVEMRQLRVGRNQMLTLVISSYGTFEDMPLNSQRFLLKL